jgi:hypothetical protein
MKSLLKKKNDDILLSSTNKHPIKYKFYEPIDFIKESV